MRVAGGPPFLHRHSQFKFITAAASVYSASGKCYSTKRKKLLNVASEQPLPRSAVFLAV